MSSIRARAPSASSAQVRRVMQANVGSETEPERRLRRALHRMGLRYRKDARPERDVRCKADIVFRSKRVCVFVDGCYWHGCPKHFAAPRSNTSWWLEKIAANRERDRRQSTLLRARGWSVVRVWEHDLVDERLERAVRRVVGAFETTE